MGGGGHPLGPPLPPSARLCVRLRLRLRLRGPPPQHPTTGAMSLAKRAGPGCAFPWVPLALGTVPTLGFHVQGTVCLGDRNTQEPQRKGAEKPCSLHAGSGAASPRLFDVRVPPGSCFRTASPMALGPRPGWV